MYKTYILNWCKQLSEDDLRNVETCTGFDGLYVKMYIILKYSAFVVISEMTFFITLVVFTAILMEYWRQNGICKLEREREREWLCPWLSGSWHDVAISYSISQFRSTNTREHVDHKTTPDQAIQTENMCTYHMRRYPGV